ncbi:hypothetical protein FN846DRAFT_434646 [Sphaerosporella brunnea]|uniref:Uncharacterized protein n=1 Tax=Sphaerosporella brunnea TaxID=1250544 RepID=A0A5J5EEX5_9PEZI|nr:hypothetical protein FN846DRAFT_434646 [Sphaerosporella brunnea]
MLPRCSNDSDWDAHGSRWLGSYALEYHCYGSPADTSRMNGFGEQSPQYPYLAALHQRTTPLVVDIPLDDPALDCTPAHQYECAEAHAVASVDHLADLECGVNERRRAVYSPYRYEDGDLVTPDAPAIDDGAEFFRETQRIPPVFSKARSKRKRHHSPFSVSSFSPDSAIDMRSVREASPSVETPPQNSLTLENRPTLERFIPVEEPRTLSTPFSDGTILQQEQEPSQLDRINRTRYSDAANIKDTSNPPHFQNLEAPEGTMSPRLQAPYCPVSAVNNPVFFQSPASQFLDPVGPSVGFLSPFNACKNLQEGNENLQDFDVDFVPDWGQECARSPTEAYELGTGGWSCIDTTEAIEAIEDDEGPFDQQEEGALEPIERSPRPFMRGAINRYPTDSPLWLQTTLEVDRLARLACLSSTSTSSDRYGSISRSNSPIAPSTTPTSPANSEGLESICSIEKRAESIECGNFSLNPLSNGKQLLKAFEQPTGCDSIAETCSDPGQMTEVYDSMSASKEGCDLDSSPRPSITTISSESSPSPITLPSTAQTSPGGAPVYIPRFPPNVVDTSTAHADVWSKHLSYWACDEFPRIFGTGNPGALEYLTPSPDRRPIIQVTAKYPARVDRSFLEENVQKICNAYARGVKFEIRIGQGNVCRTGDHNQYCEWPANNSRFQQIPSCGACIGIGDCTTASLGGFVELKIGDKWETFGLTSHHLLEERTEDVSGDGVMHGLLRGVPVEKTTQPSLQYHNYNKSLLERELQVQKVLDKIYLGRQIQPTLARSAKIEAELRQYEDEVDLSFGRIMYSSGFDRMTPQRQAFDYALIGDIAKERLSAANYVDRPPERWSDRLASITEIVPEHFFDVIFDVAPTLGYTSPAEPDFTPPEPVFRVHGIGAATGEQDGYMSPMPFTINFEGFGKGSREWSFAPRTPNGLGKSGDSGAWIFDPFGSVIGMILGHNSGSNLTYFTPMHAIFKDIKELTGATDVRLPGGQPAALSPKTVPSPKTMRNATQSYALRGACGGSSSTPHPVPTGAEIASEVVAGNARAAPWSSYNTSSSTTEPDDYPLEKPSRPRVVDSPNSFQDSTLGAEGVPTTSQKRKRCQDEEICVKRPRGQSCASSPTGISDF